MSRWRHSTTTWRIFRRPCFRGIDAGTDRCFCRVQVHQSAIAHPLRRVVADANDACALGAGNTRDQTGNFRRTNVEGTNQPAACLRWEDAFAFFTDVPSNSPAALCSFIQPSALGVSSRRDLAFGCLVRRSFAGPKPARAAVAGSSLARRRLACVAVVGRGLALNRLTGLALSRTGLPAAWPALADRRCAEPRRFAT